MSPVKVNCSHCLGNKNEDLSLCKRHFNALNAKWKKKLEKSGFQDIESEATYTSGAPDGNLKQWHSEYFQSDSRYTAESFKEKEEYYRRAGQFLHSHLFSHKQEKMAWELHSRGYSVISILTVLRGLRVRRFLGKKLNKRNVDEAVRRLAKAMLADSDNE